MICLNLMINVIQLNIVDLFLSLLNLPTDGDFLVKKCRCLNTALKTEGEESMSTINIAAN